MYVVVLHASVCLSVFFQYTAVAGRILLSGQCSIGQCGGLCWLGIGHSCLSGRRYGQCIGQCSGIGRYIYMSGRHRCLSGRRCGHCSIGQCSSIGHGYLSGRRYGHCSSVGRGQARQA